ncbi:MAG: DUF4115 domain-containing protein [Ignavibacteriales bacterium]|nr:DUF4115 domain-containing protein [Ignavibacteriales bacterium]
MANESLKNFADELKNIRETKGITLQYIASRTKIDIKYLQAIEEANFGILPELYVRAFIKEYALTIDLNAADTIKKFDQAKTGKTETETKHEHEKVTVHEKEEEKNKFEEAEKPLSSTTTENVFKNILTNKNNLLIAGASFVVILILAYFLFINKGETEIIAEEPYAELNAGESNSRFEIDSTEHAQVTAPQDDSLDLQITASGKVWVKVLKDNKEIFRNFIESNQRKNFRAYKEFRVVVGNAGAVKLSLENKVLLLNPKMGEIRNYIINSDTVKSYLISVPAKNEKKPPAKN